MKKKSKISCSSTHSSSSSSGSSKTTFAQQTFAVALPLFK